jgi:hypothetical protein
MPETDARAASSRDLRALIKNRADVQTIALDLSTLIVGNEESIGNDAIYKSIVTLCIGATFSLWRAVPLVHERKSPVANVKVGREYLDEIVNHNAITYGVDTRSRDWAFGYYLNNARFRIAEICSERFSRSFPQGKAAMEQLGSLDFVASPRPPYYSAEERVAKSIEALRAIVDCLGSYRKLE